MVENRMTGHSVGVTRRVVLDPASLSLSTGLMGLPQKYLQLQSLQKKPCRGQGPQRVAATIKKKEIHLYSLFVNIFQSQV
jgi:hypothetical protein